ncbi:MAG: helix-turn-helix transcriptional regulator [Solirubrobacterales bacterium]
MKIETLNTDQTVLAELGRRLARTRLERNISQEGLATGAGVSKSTVERLEAGRSVKLPSFLRVLRALGQLEVLDRLVPEPLPSPIERVRLQGRRRQRARPRKHDGARPQAPWTWGTGEPTDDSP